MADIYTYTDYRQFLRDAYAEKKIREKNFSYRVLAARLGLKSVGFITWVFQGKRNLSPRLTLKVAEVFRLSKAETAFFELLVQYNQAKSHEERKHHFDRLIALRRPSARVPIDPGQYEFYEQWYYSAIRELIAVRPFRGDFHALARSLTPAISPSQARQAMEVLLRLGIVVKDGDGRFIRKENSITTGEHWKSVAITHFQRQALDLAKDAVDRFPKEERDISTLTVSCSQATFESIKDKLQMLRRELATLVANDENPEGVYQFNFQLFPLAPPAKPAKSVKELRK